MEVLQRLGIALGFATLAGIDLYLTVFATSLALYNGWIVLSPQYQDLAILGHPTVLIISGFLYFVEFFADKVPWLDSAWDAVHTAIRPLGGAFLAIETLGHPDPVFDVVIGLLAGAVSLTTHGAKAGTRLLVNGSPEPFSNIAVSVGEDVGVGAGLGVMAYSYKHSPYLALIVFSAIILTLLYLMPKILRFARIKIWLLWKKLSSPATDPQAANPARELPADEDILLGRLNPSQLPVAWAARCLTGSSKGGLPSSFTGFLVALEGESARLHFVGRRGWRSLAKTLELDGWKSSHESRFLSEDLTLYQPVRETRQIFVFDRSKAPLVERLAGLVRERLAAGPGSTGHAPALESSEGTRAPDSVAMA
jgi:uncharacterized membrane protein